MSLETKHLKILLPQPFTAYSFSIISHINNVVILQFQYCSWTAPPYFIHYNGFKHKFYQTEPFYVRYDMNQPRYSILEFMIISSPDRRDDLVIKDMDDIISCMT